MTGLVAVLIHSCCVALCQLLMLYDYLITVELCSCCWKGCIGMRYLYSWNCCLAVLLWCSYTTTTWLCCHDEAAEAAEPCCYWAALPWQTYVETAQILTDLQLYRFASKQQHAKQTWQQIATSSCIARPKRKVPGLTKSLKCSTE